MDATPTKKHGKSYYGCKLSVSMDYQHGFIRGIATGTASEHDGHHFDEVLDTSNTGQRREMLKALGLKAGTQRRAQKNRPLSDCQHKRNGRIAKQRAKVKHIFASIRHMGGKHIRTIGMARATVAMTLMAKCDNLKRLATFLHRGVDAFYKTTLSKTQVRLQTEKT